MQSLQCPHQNSQNTNFKYEIYQNIIIITTKVQDGILLLCSTLLTPGQRFVLPHFYNFSLGPLTSTDSLPHKFSYHCFSRETFKRVNHETALYNLYISTLAKIHKLHIYAQMCMYINLHYFTLFQYYSKLIRYLPCLN